MDTIEVRRHAEPYTEIQSPDGRRLARLHTFQHEAAGWADATVRHHGAAVVLRPADYDGCPCNRCRQGWTASEGRQDDRELPGDRLA